MPVNVNPKPEESDFVKNMPPLEEIDIHPDGLVNLVEALIESTKKDYISLAKARYQNSGWDHRRCFNNPLNFVRRDPYGIFKTFGNGLEANDIFDAWDKLMLKDIKKGDWVEITTRDLSVPIGSVCEVLSLHSGGFDRSYDYYILKWPHNKKQYKATLKDISLYPKPPVKKS